MQVSLKGINESFNLLTKGIGGVAAALGVGAILEAGKQFADFAEQTLHSAEQLGKTADEIGITTTQLQGLQYAATQSSTSQEALTTGLERLTRTIGQAADGAKKQQQAFVTLGVSFLDAGGHARETHDVLLDLSDAIMKLPTQAQRAAAEVAVFGRAGQEMDAFMRQGASSISELENKARSLGMVLGENEVQAAHRADAEIEGLRLNWERLTEHIVISAVPALEKFIGLLARLTNPMPVYRDQLLALDKQIEATKLALKADEHAFTFFGLISSGADAALKHLLELEKEASNLRLMFEDVTGEIGQRGLSPAKPPTPPPVVTSHGQSQAEKDAAAYALVTQRLHDEILALQGHEEQLKLDTALREAHAKAGSVEADVITQQVTDYYALKKSKEDDVKLTQEAKTLLEKYEAPVNKYLEDLTELNRLYGLGKISLKDFTTATAQLQDAMAKADPAAKQLAEDQKQLQQTVVNLAGSLAQDLGRAFTDAGSSADRFKNLAVHALQDVLTALTDLLKKSLEGAGGTGTLGSLFGNILGSLFGAATGSSGFVGGAAVPIPTTSFAHLAGGGALDAGQWAVVGEQGPELFRASGPGDVWSNRDLASLGAGAPTAFYTIDARGADSSAIARLEATLRELHRSIEPRAVAAVSNERKRGGAFAAAFNR